MILYLEAIHVSFSGPGGGCKLSDIQQKLLHSLPFGNWTTEKCGPNVVRWQT